VRCQPTHRKWFIYKTLIPLLYITLFITVNYKKNAKIDVRCFRLARFSLIEDCHMHYKFQLGLLRINQHLSWAVCYSSAKPFNCRDTHNALKMVPYIKIRQGLSKVVLWDMKFVCLDLPILPDIYHSVHFNGGHYRGWTNGIRHFLVAVLCQAVLEYTRIHQCISCYAQPCVI
jgi:hypothetical protein